MKGKTRSKKLIRVSVIVYIVVLCVMATATAAWFIFDETATVRNEGNMHIQAGSRLEICRADLPEDQREWGQEIVMNTPEYTYPDITGDGETFYYPMSLDSDDQTFDDPMTFHRIEDEEADQYYITVRLQFRCSANTSVYLAEDSLIEGLNLDDPDANPSVYGEISRDGIAGAVRVAFLEEMSDGSLEPKSIWIPNDDYHLYYNGDEAKFKREVADQNGFISRESFLNTSAPYGYTKINEVSDSIKHVPFSEQQYYNRSVTVGHNGLATPASDDNHMAMLNDAKELLTFKNTGKAEVKTLIIRIWIEGTDRESEKAHVGGKLQYKFHFVCENKAQDAEQNTSVDSIVYDANAKTLIIPDSETSLNGLLEYSYNGIDWISYEGMVATVAEKQTFYVRYAETALYRSSKVVEISIPTE